jgi:O-antigen biosynthesis protein
MENLKVSIFTATHDTKYLNELYNSIKKQTYENWEWVIVPNNGAKVNIKDPKVKIVPYIGKVGNVGALKKYACEQCTGDFLAEVDHDDILTPDCLEKVVEAFKQPEIGFVYSDNAKLGEFKPYSPVFGWSYRMFEYEGKQLYAMYNQPLTPGRFSYIWFAPDHIRVWRKTVYDQIGGHNPKLNILDDLDLMHRTYMVTKFKYIREVLYIYRITGENTWLKRNSDIQKGTREMYLRDIYPLAMRFADLHGLQKIDLCGGFSKPAGFTSIDLERGDIIADLNQGIPLANNSVGVVRAHDALEHLYDPIKTMKEIHRVLVKGGILLSVTPSTDGRGAWQDPTHVSFWNQNSFWYWTRPEQMQYINNKDFKFRECYLNTVPLSEYNKQNRIVHVLAHLEKI